jgi:hypothetical protein
MTIPKVVLTPFTEAPDGALDYATMREAGRLSGWRLEGNRDWPRGRIDQAAAGRGAFDQWYFPIMDTFDAIENEIKRIRGDDDHDTDDQLQELISRGDRMHDFYSKELEAGRIPHLRNHRGGNYQSVLRAWEHLRRNLGPGMPAGLKRG